MKKITSAFAKNNITVEISIYENRLLMLHSEFFNQQFPLEGLGVEVIKLPGSTKLSVWHRDGETYQSLFLLEEDSNFIIQFFKALGFPVPQPIVESE